MKAVFHTGYVPEWLPEHAPVPWALLPVANRPLLEYWVEIALEMGIHEVVLLLGEKAYEIESYAGDGSRWGVQVTYGFLRKGHGPAEYLKRKQKEWSEGLFFLGGSDFLRRNDSSSSEVEIGSFCRWGETGEVHGLICPDGNSVMACLEGETEKLKPVDADAFGWSAFPLRTAKAYYELNMDLARGEIRNYVTPGYELQEEGSYLGYNVLTPPSCELKAPLLVGNNVRFRPLSVIGPGAIIGSHVVIDSQTQVKDSVVMDSTYIGRNLLVEQKIVCGGLVLDPETGTVLDLEDPLLFDRERRQWRWMDAVQILAGKGVALMLWMLQLPLFLLLYPWIRLTGSGRFTRVQVPDRLDRPLRLPQFHVLRPTFAVRLFQALSLDRWPAVGRVLRDRLYLCGHEAIDPEREPGVRERLSDYLPAAFSEELVLTDLSAGQREMTRLWSIHNRSPLGDLQILISVLTGRFAGSFSTPSPGEPDA